MNKLFTKIATLSVGLAMAIGVGVAVGGKDAARVSAADTKVSFTTGSNTVAIKVNWNSAGAPSSNNGIRMGSSSNAGSATFSIPSGTTKFGFYAVGWNNKATTASVSASVGTITTSTASLTSNSAATGTINANATVAITETEANAKKEFTISGVTSASTITLTTSGSNKRLIAWDAYYVSADATLSSISVETAPTKTSYLEGDHFDPTGLVITRTYSDSTSDTYAYAGHSSEFNFSPTTSAALTTSNTSVTITYGGKTTSQAITVTAPKTPASVSSSGQTTTFDSGDTFAYGGTLTATYTDSTSAGVSPTSFKIGAAGIDPKSSGTTIVPGTTELTKNDHNGKTVYVLYTENNTTVYTSYVITVKAESVVTFTGGTDKGDTTESITKSGITISTASGDGTFVRDDNFRVYSGKNVTISSSVGNIQKIEFTCTSASYNTLSGTGYTKSSEKGTWTGDSSSITLNANGGQARITKIVVTLASTDPVVELDVTSATSVSMFKGDPDESIKVHVLNIETKTWTFTFDEGGDTGKTLSSYITVSAGAAVSDVHTLTITTKAVGSTILHISVSGTVCESTIPVTVNAKPASITITHSDVINNTLEMQTSSSYKQMTFAGEDTDGNAFSVSASDVTAELLSGSDYVTISGTRITPSSNAGTAVVRYILNVLTSVKVDLTVNVIDDYLVAVHENGVAFKTGLSASQGDSPSLDIFTSRTGDTHFGNTDDIPLSYFRFSYTDAMGVVAEQFGYDYSHGTEYDSTHKDQTIYVYCTLGNVKVGEYSIRILQVDDPLTAITISNVTNHAKSITRGDTFQLTIAYTPTNPTDGKEVIYSVSNVNGGDGISVDLTGLVSVSSTSGLGTARVNVKSAHDDSISDYVIITAVLESMTYVVNETESWEKTETLSLGDEVVLVGENDGTYYGMGLYADGNNVPSAGTLTIVNDVITAGKTNSMIYTVVEGTEDDTFGFKGSDDKYIYASSNTKNYMYSKTSLDANGSFTASYGTGFSLIAQGTNSHNELRFNYNQGTPIFSCYGSTSTQPNVEIYKKKGGNTNYDVTEALFNGIHNNFGGEGKTYEWDSSCANFDGDAWEDACDALMGITGYSSYKLNRAVGNMSGNEVEQFLAKYDIIIGKVGTAHDHLSRFSNGGINAGIVIDNPLHASVGNNAKTIAIVVIISTITAVAIGGYFFLRKKED